MLQNGYFVVLLMTAGQNGPTTQTNALNEQ